jgi:DNA-binding SARP family transcriptional activator/WD40 repeat protein
MEFQTLGAVQARVDGLPVELGEPQQRLVLALLLANADSVVSTDRLIAGIWGDEPPASSRKIVQGYVSRLRKALGGGDIIESQSPGYRLVVKPQQIDALMFERHAAEGAAQVGIDPHRARQELENALSLWHGTPYEDLSDYDMLRPEIVRLEQLHAAAVEARIEADILSGQHTAVTTELADLTGRYPLRERLWSLRMLALYRSGRQAEALRVYDEARQTLAAEVGLDPSAELRLLEQRILDQDPVLDTLAALESDAGLPTTAERNPYKGLRPFDETDAADFYGRDALVRRLREALNRRTGTRLVVLAGPSGSGKSSVVRAGLIPQLRLDGWSIATMYPGGAPLQVLDAAVEALAPQPRSLLVVDQLEEVITMAPEGSQTEFLDRLGELATGQESPWVMVTVRADFLDRLLLHPRFARLVEPGLLLVTPLEDHEVREVIVAPASRVGASVEPDLVAAMVRDVANRAATLPLLEYALTDLYDRAGGGPMTLQALDAAGGISGALVKRAEELYTGLDQAGRATARQLFLRLVSLTDDGEALRSRVSTESLDALAGIEAVMSVFGQHRLLTFDRDRKGSPTVEVAHEALLSEWPRIAQWIDEARASIRMLRQLADAASEWESHGRAESYLLAGARLARYADWPGAELALSDGERQYLAGSREREERERARRRRRRTTVLAGFATVAAVAVVLAVAALVARQDAADNAVIAEAAAEQAEQSASVAQQSEAVAQQRAREAQSAEALAQSRELAASAVAVLEGDPELSMLLALEAIDAAPPGETASPAGVLALREALQQHRLLVQIPGDFTDAQISPDGSTLFVTSKADRSVMALDATTGAVAWSFDDPSIADAVPEFQRMRILHLSVSPDGALVAVSIPDLSTLVGAESIAAPARVIVLDAVDGEVIEALEFPCPLSTAQESGFSPDGNWLAIHTGDEGCFDFERPEASWVSLLDTTTWQEGARLQMEGAVLEVANFNADGSRFLIHDLATANAELRSFPQQELVNQIPDRRGYWRLGPTGEQMVLRAPTDSRRRLLVRAENNETISYLEIDDFATGDSMQFSQDGSMLGVPTRTHDYVFSTEDGELLVDLGNTGTTNTMDFTADGTRLLTTNSTGAQIWDLTGRTSTSGSALTVPGADENWINPNAVVDGTELAIRVIVDDGPRDDKDAWVTLIIDPDAGSTIDHIVGDSLQLPDGRFVVAQRSLGIEERRLGPLVVLDRTSGSTTELDPCVALLDDLLDGSETDCPGAFFSWYAYEHDHLVSGADGSFFVATSYASSDSDRTVRIWDSESLEIRSQFSIPYFQQAIAAGSSWVAAINNADVTSAGDIHPEITVYDIDSGAVVTRLEGPSNEAFADTINALSQDGSILFVGDFDGRAVAFDTSSWERVAEWRAHNALLRGFAVSPDGGRLVTTGQDNLVKVWDLSGLAGGGSIAGPPPLLDRIPAAFPTDAAWLSSDRLGVFLSEGVQYLNVSLNVEDLIGKATQRLTRSFSIEECAVYQIEDCPTLEQVRAR